MEKAEVPTDFFASTFTGSQACQVLRVLMVEKLDMNLQCVLTAQKTNCIWDCTTRNVASRSREEILPPYILPL